MGRGEKVMELKNNGPVLKTLLISDLVESTCLVEKLGDKRAALLFARHDRLARDLLARHGGLEIDKADGFLLLFERPLSAVRYALEYHEVLARLAAELEELAPEARLGETLAARVGIHLGEIFLRHNPADDVARGAKPIEVEGLAKPLASRLMSLAAARQTLVTRGAFELARRAAVDMTVPGGTVCWLCHGAYRIHGVEHPTRIYEVGLEGVAPLTPPEGTEKMRPTAGEETLPRRWLTHGSLPARPRPKRRHDDAPPPIVASPAFDGPGDQATVAVPAMWETTRARIEPAWTRETNGQELIRQIATSVTVDAEKKLALERVRGRHRLVATAVVALLLIIGVVAIQEHRLALQVERTEQERERASHAVETSQHLSRLLADLVATRGGEARDPRLQQDRYGDAAPYGRRPMQPTGGPDDGLILLRPPGSSYLQEPAPQDADELH